MPQLLYTQRDFPLKNEIVHGLKVGVGCRSDDNGSSMMAMAILFFARCVVCQRSGEDF